MLNSTLCDCSDSYILVNGITTIVGGAFVAAIIAYRNSKNVILKNCIPFTVCISEINNIHLYHEKYLDIVMQMCNLTEYIYNYVKTRETLEKYCTDKPNNNITDVNHLNLNQNLQIIVLPSKYSSNFWRNLEMSLINYEITLPGTFAITDTKFFFQL